jgi:limonene-1,2-epoxide hydrolase
MSAAMTDDQKLARVHEMAAAWKALDWRKVADMFTPDGVLHSMMVEPVVGREAVYTRVSGLGDGLTAITLNFKKIGVVDGAVFVERTDEFLYRGRTGKVPVVGILEFDGPLISVWREYYDRAHLLHEMGLDTDFDAATR